MMFLGERLLPDFFRFRRQNFTDQGSIQQPSGYRYSCIYRCGDHGSGVRYRCGVYLQLFRGKLHYDQSWRWCIHRIYALFPAAGIGRPDGKTGTDDCKSRLYRLFYRLTSAFRYPLRRTLCESAVLRKPVKIQKQTR